MRVHVFPDYAGVEFAFQGEDAVGEGVWVIAGQDVDDALSQRWAVVVGVCNDVDGAAAFCIAVRENCGVDVLAVESLAGSVARGLG